jgi:GTP-binding protein
LAKVSCVPGKTQAINIFDIDKSIYLADLPGYGFSQTGKQLQSGWDALMGQFLIDYRPFVIVLTDGRHPLFESDKEMISWLKMHMIPYTIVATKADKLNRSELHKKTNEFLHTFGEKPLYFSVEDIIGRNQLLHKMQSYIETSKNLQETPTLAYS